MCLHLCFLASVAKIANLQKIPFGWHIMHSEDYEKQVKAKGDVKKFDFIHMIQVYDFDSRSLHLKSLNYKTIFALTNL